LLKASGDPPFDSVRAASGRRSVYPTRDSARKATFNLRPQSELHQGLLPTDEENRRSHFARLSVKDRRSIHDDYARRKKYAWIALAAGVGGTLMFVLFASLTGRRASRNSNFFSGYRLIGCSGSSALLLKKYYRENPQNSQDSGTFRLSTCSELLYSRLLQWPPGARHGPCLSCPAACRDFACWRAFAFCLLLAARKGFQYPPAETAKAMSVLLSRSVGTAIGSLGVLTVVVACYGPAAEVIQCLGNPGIEKKSDYDRTSDRLSLRIGMLCLPFGYAFARFPISCFPAKMIALSFRGIGESAS